ncbi:hypothetical protein TrVE_jg5802 [Triparma verrucosa]|uniref:Guanylate kinase-like domain-containing protein n=1 Tax=Triparma verrucosa TaxID=1606542 RepID=A0A9W7FBT2_9STRA|nr:hypothetical protein TrVE_jg5802 [Triparma verrucosa]
MSAQNDPASALTFSEISDLNARKKAIKASHAAYVQEHPEIKSMLNDFMSACLLEKPNNIYSFAVSHFSDLAPHHSHVLTSSGPTPLVLSGPPGTGKKTLFSLLQKLHYSKFDTPLQTTSRPPRPDEENNVDYIFLPLSTIQQKIEDNQFVEYTSHPSPSGPVIYGLEYSSIQSVRSSSAICVILTDTLGHQKIKSSGMPFKSIFIKPPNLDALSDRLLDSGVEEDLIPPMLDSAKDEILYGETPTNFDAVITNGVLEDSFSEFSKIIKEWYGKSLEEDDEEKDEEKEEKENEKEEE